jgi:hypothetical protein
MALLPGGSAGESVSNQTGDAYAFMAMTPIVDGMETELRSYIEGFTQETSPFAALPQTHFARWVIVRDWVNDRSQPHQDHLGCAYLLFTANLHGDIEVYLDALCGRPEAETIWSRCAGAPKPCSGDALKAYLLHNQIDTGFFVAAYPDASVEQVRESLALREQLIAFAAHSQGMDAEALQRDFNAEFGL